MTSVANQLTIAARKADDPPEDEPDDVREREQQAEEHRQPRAVQVVLDADADRLRRLGRERRRVERIGRSGSGR